LATRPASSARRRREDEPPLKRRSLVGRTVYWAAVAAIWIGLAGTGLVGWFAYDLPDVNASAIAIGTPVLRLAHTDGTPLATVGELYGEAVRLDEVPPWLPAAVLAIEDRRFYRHGGVDVRGIARAAWANLRAGSIRQGGSTITQQLAKNLFLSPRRTWRRKVQETLLAVWLERRFTKRDILTLYLNRVYLGAGTYGVEAAARRYFGKSARHVTLAEAAMLAGLLKAPSRYAPSTNPQGARRRGAVVIDAMVEAGSISADQARLADAQSPIFARPHRLSRRGRYFADWVVERVPGYAGRVTRNLTVVTTLDPDLQGAAEDVIHDTLAREGPSHGASQAALVALGADGAIKAMVGGSDHATAPFNRAVYARRQPGSAFKLFVYLAGLEAGYAPDSLWRDAPVAIDGWRPRNYSGSFAGTVTMSQAFARSINTVAVRVAEAVGRERVVATAERLGIVSVLAPHPSLALGTAEVGLLELTAAYTTLSNGGYGILAHGIREIGISEIGSRAGGTLYRREGSGLGRAIGERDVRAMTSMLEAVVTEGTGRAADPGRPAGGKTGTSEDHRDAWFVGFAGGLTAGVWVGNDEGTPMKGVTGGGLPARIWRSFMMRAGTGRTLAPRSGGASPSDVAAR